MSLLLDRSSITVNNPNSILSFENKGGGAWKIWDRFLCVEGKPAYHIGNVCGTCEFFFTREEGANRKVSPMQVSARLRAGLQSLDAQLTQDIASILPSGTYRVSLLMCTPELTRPGAEKDYFSHEQVDLWGIDPFWGVPHSPRTEYYRVDSRFLGENLPLREALMPPNARRSHLFEFCIPMYPGNWLDRSSVETYRNRFTDGECPTALAISILDVKQPATWEGQPKINEHWCLAHYLLDGHHKIYAAAALGKRLTVLSFMESSRGISTENDAEYLLLELSR